MTYMLLCRSVCRTTCMCNWCGYEIAPYQSMYAPTVGGVALGRYCTRRCSELTQGARMELAYD